MYLQSTANTGQVIELAVIWHCVEFVRNQRVGLKYHDDIDFQKSTIMTFFFRFNTPFKKEHRT